MLHIYGAILGMQKTHCNYAYFELQEKEIVTMI